MNMLVVSDEIRTTPNGIIYGIFHRSTKRAYIGSTIDVRDRHFRHISALSKNKHKCPFLQHVANTYGIEAIEFEIIEIIWRDFSENDLELRKREAEVFEQHRRDGWEMMNTMTPVEVTRWTHSEETREKIRQHFLGKPGAPRTKEWNERVGNATRGRRHTEEAKEKNRLAHLGKTASAETKALLSSQRRGSGNVMFGRSHSEETKDKIRATKAARPNARIKFCQDCGISKSGYGLYCRPCSIARSWEKRRLAINPHGKNGAGSTKPL